MMEFDCWYMLGRLIQAAAFLPVALAIMLACLWAMGRALGIGSGIRYLRTLFNTIEADPLAVAVFLGAVVIAAGSIAAALVR